MDSIWLCCDPDPPRTLRNVKSDETQPSSGGPFLGIFTKDPAILGPLLPRPVTPALGGTPPAIETRKHVTVDMEYSRQSVCESPPSEGSLDFKASKLVGVNPSGISFF
jgi:hypothetical protein